MNINDYRDAMNNVTPDRRLKERIMDLKAPQRRYIPVYRIVSGTLVAVLALTSLFTVAMAASPELRNAVLSFFHMEEKEQIPGQSGVSSTPDVSRTEIGELVKAQYIKMDQQYDLFGDLLADLTWSEDCRTLLNADFWEIRDNELAPVEIDMHTQRIDVTYGDVRYQGELYWYVRKGALYAFKGIPFGVDTRPEDQWYVNTFPGRTDAVMLRVEQGWQMERTEFTLLYYLDTGEVEDLFAGIDPAVMEESDGSIWSPGARRILITGQAGPEFPDGREWLYDRESGILSDVSSLGGVGADMAVFVDDDTLILRVYAEDSESGHETIACWVYDIPSGRAYQTLNESPCYRQQDENPCGVIPFYGGSCMEIREDGEACLIDLTTGTRSRLENFIFQKNMNFTLNPSGDRLLYYAMDRATEGIGIAQLGTIDLEKGAFIAFDREGYENLHEESISWADDHTVRIDAASSDGEARYIILYQF